ncbi:MAG: protein translocase subunit SecD [Gemmatimonadota bacterium]
MLTSIRGRIVVILLLVVGSGAYLYQRGIKLGLDLQGGMHLVLEVDDPSETLTVEARSDAIDRAQRIIRTRIDELGVEEPLIQKVGQDRLIIELAGISDEARAKEIIGQTAFLEWKLVRRTGEMQAALPRIDRAVVASLGADALREMGRDVEGPSTQNLEALIFGGETADTATEGSEEGATAEGEAAGEDTDQDADVEAEESTLRPFTALLNQGGFDGVYLVAEEDVEMARRFLALPEVERALPRGVTLQWGWQPVGVGARTYRELYILESTAFLTGDMLEDATANRDPQFNQAQVQFQLSRQGGRRFSDLTGQHIGDNIAIVLDNEVVSAPVVRDRIGARGQIDLGQAPMEEARDLALVLRAGALPAPLRVMEERTVGPSLGQDSIDQGQMAGIIGLILVILVMIGYYRFGGFLAVIALSVYVLLVMGGLAALNATLTLPGIAGLILSIGMAVDANVLIFERIREELDVGRTVRTAVDEGFGHALSAIVDANLTTLITALILFQFGTGPVRGFAVTLSIGIVASFFSALYVTRTLFLVYLGRKRTVDALSI